MKDLRQKIYALSALAPLILPTKKAWGANLKDAFNIAGEAASSSYNTDRDLYLIIGDAVAVVLSLLGVIFIIFMIYAGFLWLTAAGNDQKVDKAKTMLKQAIIGLIIVIAAYTITYFVIKIFGSQLKIQ